MSTPLIKVEGLGKQYRRGSRRASYQTLGETLGAFARGALGRGKALPDSSFWAVQNLSFEVNSGDVVGIIGRNGAGKSTLLKMMGRITHPSAGSIRLNGRVASLLEVGTGFHPELSGRENIFLNGAILGMTRKEVQRKFDEIVAFAGVDGFLDTAVKFYSSGMYVRLAFAVAAYLDQEILLVDEVLAVGDIAFQRKCLERIREVSHDQGRCVLFVSHNNAAVASLCNRGLVLQQGQCIFDGTAPAALAVYNEALSRREFARLDRGDVPQIVSVDLDEQALGSGRLRVSVGFNSPRELRPPVIGVTVATAMGAPVFGVNTQMDERLPQEPRASGVATLDIGQLPLLTGSYKLSAWLSEPSELHDVQHDALSFDLVSDQSLPPGVSIEVAGPVAVNGRWQLGALR